MTIATTQISEDAIIDTDTTVAAISTPLQVGGISIVRISGKDAIKIADCVFKAKSGQPLSERKGYTASFGSAFYRGKELDTSIATVFIAPKSYTGENVVEISCHGGLYSTKTLLRAVIEAGATLATAGEFTKRAFLNGKLTLTQAEAVIDMINSENEQALNAAKGQLDGALFKKIQQVKDDLLKSAGHLAAWVDYPEEDIEEVETESLSQTIKNAIEEMEQLVASYDIGRVIKEGIETAIVGKPNVGKSTLMNLLLRTKRSIVTDVAGTTRDVIEDTVSLGEVTLRLWDTAGIRETSDTVEKIGVELAMERLERAALILAVFDGSQELDNEDIELLKMIKERPVIAIVNKDDLKQRIDIKRLEAEFSKIIYISNEDITSFDRLVKEIKEKTSKYSLDPAAGFLANERQLNLARAALLDLREGLEAVQTGVTLDAVSVLLDEAIEKLLMLTGQRITEEIVNEVFSHFCVGK